MSILTRKYPFPQSSHWLRDCSIYCIIVFLILYLLQPFGFSMYQGNKLLVSLLFGAVTFGCCLICNFLVFSVVFHFSITLGMFLLFLYWTLIIGVFVTICSVSLNYYRYLRNQLEALLDKTTEEQSDITVTIHDTTVRGNDLLLPINDLLYVEAQKNNVAVCYVKEGKTATTELHTTLAAVLDDLQAYQNIFQCHRSFVVNLNNITSAQGNSNGYQLKMGKCPTTVPVSRTYVPKLKSYIA